MNCRRKVGSEKWKWKSRKSWEGEGGSGKEEGRRVRRVVWLWREDNETDQTCFRSVVWAHWHNMARVEMLEDNRQRWKPGWNPEKWLELKFWLSGKAAKELLQGGCEPHSKRSRLWIYNLTNKSYLHPYHSLIKTCFWRLSQFIFPSLKKEEIAVDFKADAYKAYMHSIHIMHFENMKELDNVREWLDCWMDWWLK